MPNVTPKITNTALTLAATEYALTIPQGTSAFMLQCRGGDCKYSFTAEESGTVYMTLAMGQSYYEETVNLDGKVIYIQAPTTGCVAELLTWNQGA